MGSFSLYHWILVLVILGALIGLVFFLKKKSKSSSGELKGVGGWLVLPLIGFFGVIFLTAKNLLEALQEIENLKAIFADTTGKLDALKLPMALSFIFGIAIIVSASICLYRILIAKKSVKNIAVAHYLILGTGGIVELWGASAMDAALPGMSNDPSFLKDAIRGVMIAVIWIPYFLLSKRVKNTFETPNNAVPLDSSTLREKA